MSTTLLSTAYKDSSLSWLEEYNRISSLSLQEQLVLEAESLEKQADHFQNCSFIGQPPSFSLITRANLLRKAAAAISAKNNPKKPRAKQAKKANTA